MYLIAFLFSIFGYIYDDDNDDDDDDNDDDEFSEYDNSSCYGGYF